MQEVESPIVKTKNFKNIDAALDYCKFAEPQELSIKRIVEDNVVTGYQLVYTGSKGER